MENKTCADCQHYVQHYIKFMDRFNEVCCGHCVYPRIKSRAPHTHACDKFTEKEQKNSNSSVITTSHCKKDRKFPVLFVLFNSELKIYCMC